MINTMTEEIKKSQVLIKMTLIQYSVIKRILWDITFHLKGKGVY